jgi:hypothetical protein
MANNYKDKLRAAPGAKLLPSGIDLMRRINDGLVQKNPSEYVEQVRREITENCEELIQVGARIRPLVVRGEQVGWVRAVSNAERTRLRHWVFDPDEFVLNILSIATSLTKQELNEFTGLEIHNIVELVSKMTEYDLSLYPYLSCFTTTMTSESLWHSSGHKLSSFENKVIELPDGKRMKILAPSEHARLWATLCTYREQAKKRLDESWNALLIVRPWAGKGVDSLSNELKGVARRLQTDSLEPWESIVRQGGATIDFNDGWGHAGDSPEDLLREMRGMLANDKHEQLMSKFETQQIEAAEARQRELQSIIERHGGPGVGEEVMVVETEQQVRQREVELRRGRVQPIPYGRNTETALAPDERIKKYSKLDNDIT